MSSTDDALRRISQRLSSAEQIPVEVSTRSVTAYSKQFTGFEEEEGESRLRTLLRHVWTSYAFEVSMGAVIVCNVAMVVYETDMLAQNRDRVPELWEGIVSYIFLAIYTVDCIARLIVQRSKFFCHTLNILDVSLLMTDFSLEVLSAALGAMPSVAFFRLLRILRMLRFIHVLRLFKELHIMLYGLVSAMKAMFWAASLLACILTVWSIVIVQILHPINAQLHDDGVYGDCENCLHAFESVMQCNLTLIQTIIAGDSWGLLALPLIRTSPFLAIPLLVGSLITINLGLMNLILTVIVNAAQHAHDDDIQRQLEARREAYELAKVELLKICSDMDDDGDGVLTLAEIEGGFEANPDFQAIMTLMDLTKEDMQVVFTILDDDKSGSVTYKEFVDQLHKMKSQDDVSSFNLAGVSHDFLQALSAKSLPFAPQRCNASWPPWVDTPGEKATQRPDLDLKPGVSLIPPPCLSSPGLSESISRELLQLRTRLDEELRGVEARLRAVSPAGGAVPDALPDVPYPSVRSARSLGPNLADTAQLTARSWRPHDFDASFAGVIPPRKFDPYTVTPNGSIASKLSDFSVSSV